MIGSFTAQWGARTDTPPLDPTAPEAKDLVLRELAKPEYAAARPTWFDKLASGFWDWLNSLQFAGTGGPPGLGIVIIVVIVLAALVVAFLVFGLPRINRRSTVSAELFGQTDERDAAGLRAAASAAAARGDYVLAIEELFRAIARGLAERTLVPVTPGTTARGFAASAGRVFEVQASGLADAAAAFDDVRYLGGAGRREAYDAMVDLERDLRGAKPAIDVMAAP
jgi:Domain of unknown function (DUF4129)